MLVLKTEYVDAYKKDFVERLSSGEHPIYIFGINEYAESIIENYNVKGVIDEYTTETHFKGVPIVNINDVPQNALVVVVVVGKSIIAEHVVSQYQFDYIDYYALLSFEQGKALKKMHFIDGSRDDIASHFEEYQNIYERLADNESKNCLFNIVNFRYSLNIKYMRGFKFIPEEQYFESFIEFGENEVFIDAGGFDGETTSYFISKSPGFKEAHIFEPLNHQFNNIKNKFKGNSKVVVHKLGLSDKKETLFFTDAGSASSITENGEIEIEVCNLDGFVDLEPSYIKMDIEGAEISAIKGAKQKIKKYHPKLAICVYHKPEDIREVFKSIINIRDDYTVYLRHYTQGIYETVMYFIPNK